LKDRSGATVHDTADRKIEDVTNARRAIVGTWNKATRRATSKSPATTRALDDDSGLLVITSYGCVHRFTSRG